MAAIVADTSAWAAYLAGEEVPLLENALAAGALYLPALVCAELLGNTMAKKDRKDLEALLLSLPLLGSDSAHFARAGALKAQLEEKGTPLSARDAHLIQCALDAKAVLLTRDAFFRELSPGVRVEMW